METRKYTVGTVRAFDRKKAEETRQIEFVISDESRDRHGTVIPIKSWGLENFNANGIVGYQHDVYGDSWLTKPDPDDVIGIGEAFIEGDKLIGRVTFEPAEINPKAEKIFQKVLHGTLKATSVGFVEKTKGMYVSTDENNGGKGTYYFGEVELLEFSIVNIPSNANALRRKMEDAETEIDAISETLNQLKTRNSELETLNSELQTRNAELETKVKQLQQNLQIEKMNGLSRLIN